MKSNTPRKVNNPFPKNIKCEYPECNKRMEAIMRGISFCHNHFYLIDIKRVHTKKDISTKEIRELINQVREYELFPLRKYL